MAPSNIRQISGTIPGLLDPTQPERLLRLPGSKLHFAAFDPLAATARRDVAGLPKLSIKEELCRPRRIVIETSPGGDSFWRYVPNARLEDGVEDEGEWPRAINICGETIQCSQDQWDVYKLDPLYACFVGNHPQPTQITRVTQAESAPQNSQRKRRASTPSPERSAPAPLRRKLHSDPDEDPDDVTDEDMSTIDEMIVDPLPRLNEKLGFRKTSIHREQRENPRRRAPFGRESFSYTAEVSNDFLPVDTRIVRKRKLPDIPESSSIPDMSEPTFSQDDRSSTYVRTRDGKRARTVSPSNNARLDLKRLEREKSKRERREQESFARRQERDKELFDTLVAEATRQMQEKIKEKHDRPAPAGSAKDGEHLRQAIIEESRRKIAELEADKPLWEAAAKQRMVREKEDPETIRVRAESSRTKEEIEREAQILREEEEKKRKEERLHKEEIIRRERERRRRQQQRWAFGPWTTQRALERYKVLSEEFDSTKFCADLPLTMETVPWPVLTPPTRFSVADVDWGAVEKFFSGVKEFMGTQDYKTFVEKSHRRFHPDRWRSRSLLKTVLDEMEKNNMEVAANTVAQALTPIWRGVTGR